MANLKVYGFCVERTNHLIATASRRRPSADGRPFLIEAYQTGDLDDLIDILDLHDIKERSWSAFWERIEAIARKLSSLTNSNLSFGITDDGQLGLYLAGLSPRPESNDGFGWLGEDYITEDIEPQVCSLRPAYA